MMYRWTLGSLSTVGFCLFFSMHALGQQQLSAAWQGEHLRPPSLQSSQRNDSSPQLESRSDGQSIPLTEAAQPLPLPQQSLKKPIAQKPTRPNTQEIPAVRPQPQPSTPPQLVVQPQQSEQTEQHVAPPVAPVIAAAPVPGYLGANTRNFYHERLCMHALTIRGVEIETILPNSPAAQAGLRPARTLTAKETVVATAAGLLTLTPVAAAAPVLVSLSGGIPHGDIILAVNGQRVATQDEFHSVMNRMAALTTIYLTVHRGETNVQVPVRLGESLTTAYANVQ